MTDIITIDETTGLTVNVDTTGDVIVINPVATSIEDALILIAQNTARIEDNEDLQSTSWVTGAVITINGTDNTKFDVSAGTGIHVDHATHPATITKVTVVAQTGVVVTNIATQTTTEIAVDKNGNLIQQFRFTPIDRRDYFSIGSINHANLANILSVQPLARVLSHEVALTIADLALAIGSITTSGVIVQPDGVNLKFNVTSGETFVLGIDKTNIKRSNYVNSAALAQPNFFYTWQDGVGGFNINVTDTLTPLSYDDGTGGASLPNGTVGTNKWTLMRVYVFPTETPALSSVVVHYGTAVFDNATDALADNGASFIPHPTLTNAVHRANIAVRGNASDLNDTVTAIIQTVAKFGGVAGGGGLGGGVTDHELLSNLLGGAINDHYHLTVAQRDDLITHMANHNHTKSEISDFPIVDSDVASNAAISADKIEVSRTPGSTYSTAQHLQDVFHSSGWVEGGLISINLDGTVDVTAGNGLLRVSNSVTGILKFIDWPAVSALVLTDNVSNYLYVEYNTGTPQVIATVTERTDQYTNFLLGYVYRSGLELHVTSEVRTTVGDHALRMINRLNGIMPFARENGSVLSEVGVRQIATTTGKWWAGLNDFTTILQDTSGATPNNHSFEYFYYNGSAWITHEETIDSATFTGIGLNDGTSGGVFVGSHTLNISVEIDSIGATDTFKYTYKDNDGATDIIGTGVNITGVAQNLIDGITITFASITGHTLGDKWDFDAYLSDQIDNTQYNNIASGLVTLSNNKYGVHWVYMDVHGHIAILFGQGDYTLAEANDAPKPSSTPPEFKGHTALIGRIIIGKSGTTFTSIQNNFDTAFQGSVSTDHGDLAGLADDDHAQYHNDTRGDVRYYTQSQIDSSLANMLEANVSDELSVGFTTTVEALASDTIVPDFTKQSLKTRTTAGNITINNPTTGQGVMHIVFTIDASGPRTITYGTEVKPVVGAPTSLTASVVYMMTLVRDTSTHTVVSILEVA